MTMLSFSRALPHSTNPCSFRNMEGYDLAALSMRLYTPGFYLVDMNGRFPYPIIVLCLVSILIIAGAQPRLS